MMRIPITTYRIQLNPFFGFKEAKKIIPYLAKLGISDIYVSPIFRAEKGSMHGYDVVDPTNLNPELGKMEEYEELIIELKKYGLGWLQDVVPNHMVYNNENQMLMDVLENGESSEYFRFFDIRWNHPYETLRGRIIAPFLGKFYGEALEGGEIRLEYDEAGFTINYYHLRFPLKIDSYLIILTHKLGTLKRRLGEEHPDFIKFLGILYVLKSLSSREKFYKRYNQIKFIKKMLWEIYTKNKEIKGFIDEKIKTFNGKTGESQSFNLLDNLLSEQVFRLSFWKVATEEINYRRFFNINGLISLRIEDENIFTYTHSLIFKLIEERKISGIRIDHIDGLYNPTNYLKRIREKSGEIYIVVEKILDLEEELPRFWPVQGSTGYDFLNYINGIFCQKKNEKKFDKIYSRFTGLKTPFDELVCEKKRLIIGKEMAGDVDNLAHSIKTISGRYRHGSDLTLYGLKRALVEVMAQFPVYRTYIDKTFYSKRDQFYIKEAFKKAKEKMPGLLYELNFIENVFLLDSEGLSQEEKSEFIDFVMKFQQFSSPLMAKGFEDTILYVYNRFLSLNEVGGSPNKFGISLEKFHRFSKQRGSLWPYSLNTTSTHDTKRGEDIRARINVLSEIPKEWEKNIKIWAKINKRKKKALNGAKAPDRNDEYFLYQTLVGAFPFNESEYPSFVERLKNYMVKAVREAKVHTAWLKPDINYEKASISFIEKILSPLQDNHFLKEFIPFQKQVAHYGIFNSLSQTLVKMTAPGVPDFYQGTELWDLNLVDPDNRRLVDFKKRELFLENIIESLGGNVLDLISELLSTKEDGRIKLFFIHSVLKVRKEKVEIFEKGHYLPLKVGGTFKEHVLAFARSYKGIWAISIVPRFLTTLIKKDEFPLGEQVWADTHVILPKESPFFWKEVITAEQIKAEGAIRIGTALKYFPVALLMSEVKNEEKR